MALDVVEDALADTGTPQGRGVAIGLCGAFHMCGLLSAEEWEALLKRVPVEPHKLGNKGIRRIRKPDPKARNRMLN